MNTLGRHLRVTTFGESHGPAMGFILDGFPAGIEIDMNEWTSFIHRRSPGQSEITSPRKEKDTPECLSGIFQGKSLGTPIGVIFRNQDTRSQDYDSFKDFYRPGHADFSIQEKFGIRDHRGGGRSSARETVNWVGAGGLAREWLRHSGIKVSVWVHQIGHFISPEIKEIPDWNLINRFPVRCPDADTALQMEALIRQTQLDGDSLGGVITAKVHGIPVGLGEPVFDKFPARLGQAFLSLNAVKGVEFGDGFKAAEMKGSIHNDIWIQQENKVITKTNHSGGTTGGISHGMPLEMKIAFKPASTIFQNQDILFTDGQIRSTQLAGRHDPCVVPRAVPVVEALIWLVLADFSLLKRLNKA